MNRTVKIFAIFFVLLAAFTGIAYTLELIARENIQDFATKAFVIWGVGFATSIVISSISSPRKGSDTPEHKKPK
jgi:hypothetical protein